MKTAWVLSGGGAAGCVQFGFMKAFHEAGLLPDKVFGTSAGALNAKLYCETGPANTEAVWRSIRGQGSVFNFNPATIMVASNGVHDSHPLQKLIKRNASTAKIPFDVCTFSLTHQQTKYVPHTDPFINEFTVASASIPVYVDPMVINGEVFCDGGIADTVPLKQAIKQGFDRIVVIMCSPPPPSALSDGWDLGNFVSVAIRGFEAMRLTTIRDDLDYCQQINDDIASLEHAEGDSITPSLVGKRQVEIIVAAPGYDVVDTLDFESDSIAIGIDTGHLLAQPYIIQMKGAV